MVVRLDAFPKMRKALAKLPPKMLQLHSDQPAQPVDLSTEQVRVVTHYVATAVVTLAVGLCAILLMLTAG